MSLIKPIGSPPVRYPCFYERQGVAPTIYDTLNPLVVYSMRKTLLSQNKCIRIRRDSDDAEIDVGFKGGWVDEQAIKDFGGYNMVGYSNDFSSNSVWSRQIGVVLTQTSDVAPTGENGWEVDFTNGAFLFQFVRQDISSLQDIILSLYVKGVANEKLNIGMTNSTNNHSQIIVFNGNWQRVNIVRNFQTDFQANLQSFRVSISKQAGTQSPFKVASWQFEGGNTPTTYQSRSAGGADDCFVTTCYGVAGQDAIQTTEANQPKIYDVTTGEVTKENGKPAMLFDGKSKFLDIPNVVGRSNMDAYFVNRHNDTFQSASNYVYLSGDVNNHYGFKAVKNNTNTNLKANYGNVQLYKNNVLLSPQNRGEVYSLIGQTQNIINHKGISPSIWNKCRYGIYFSEAHESWSFEGTLQELAIFDGTLNNEQRVELHADINNKFNIY